MDHDNQNESGLIQWHAGFISAMYLELREDNQNLEHISEYELNTKPIKMDLLVIKKRKDVVIRNNIGKIFRTHNVLEYKSPGDALNVDTFYKTMAYAFLYKSYGNHVDEIPSDEVTVSLVRKEKPVKLIKYWKEHGFGVVNAHPGVYHVSKDGIFPTQLIVSDELTETEHSWLRFLMRGIDADALRKLETAKEKLSTQREQEAALSVLDVAWAAKNKEDDDMRKVMKSITKEREQIAVEETKTENARRMLADGIPCEKVAEYVDLPLNRVLELAATK